MIFILKGKEDPMRKRAWGQIYPFKSIINTYPQKTFVDDAFKGIGKG